MKKISKKHILALCVLLLLSAPAPAACMFLQRNAAKEMTDLTLEQLEARIHMQSAKPQYLYIGRDDCPDCQKILPALTELNRSQSLGILAYSTSQDRETRPEEMYEILDRLQVDSVPMILTLESGEVTARYSGEEFLSLHEK